MSALVGFQQYQDVNQLVYCQRIEFIKPLFIQTLFVLLTTKC